MHAGTCRLSGSLSFMLSFFVLHSIPPNSALPLTLGIVLITLSAAWYLPLHGFVNDDTMGVRRGPLDRVTWNGIVRLESHRDPVFFFSTLSDFGYV